MILPVLKTFTVTKGTTFTYRFQWLQGVPTSAVPQPLTNFTASMAITSWNGATTYLTLATGAAPGASGIFFGGAQNDPTNGVIDIVIAASNTAAFTWTTARYNLVLTGNSQTYRLLYGSMGVFGFVP